MIEWLIFWSQQDYEALSDQRMNRLAYAARYGHQPIDILLHVDSAWLNRFVMALSEIVRREGQSKNSDDT